MVLSYRTLVYSTPAHTISNIVLYLGTIKWIIIPHDAHTHQSQETMWGHVKLEKSTEWNTLQVAMMSHLSFQFSESKL